MADNSDGKITVTWAENETMKIISANGHEATAKVTDVDGSGTATISFDIDAAAKGQNCTIIYPDAAAYTESAGVYTANPITAQDGTLKAALDVRIGTGTITNDVTPTLNVTIQPAAQFAIFKFTLGSAIDGTHPLYVKDDADNTIITVTPASSTTAALRS